MATPRSFMDYAVKYYIKRDGLLWSVFYKDRFEKIERRCAGPFLMQKTAGRLANEFTMHYRNGWDSGHKGRAIYGGGRYG